MGLIVKMRVAPPGVKAKRIDDATWAAMEASWNRAFGETAGQPVPPPEQTFEQWAANPDLSGSSTVQEQFDRFMEDSDAEDADRTAEADVFDTDDFDIGDGDRSNLEVCRAFLDENQWSYQQQEDSPDLMMGFSGDSGSWAICISAEDDGVVQIDSWLNQDVPQDRRTEMSELLTRINYGLRIGGFQFDLSDGGLGFHSGIDVKGVGLKAPTIKRLFYNNVACMDRYLGAIMAVGHAGVDAESAYAGVDHD